MKTPNVSIDIIIIRDDCILLGLLSEEWNYQDKPTYGVPGREIKFGESFGHAVERNIREELGCKLQSHSIISVNANYAFGNHYIGIGALATIEGEPQLMKPKDWQKWEWFKLHDLPDNLFPPAKNLFDSYLNNVTTVSD